MKRSTRFSYAYALQVAAVILIFSYHGCSSNNEPKGNSPDKTTVISKSGVGSKINDLKQ